MIQAKDAAVRFLTLGAKSAIVGNEMIVNGKHYIPLNGREIQLDDYMRVLDIVEST